MILVGEGMLGDCKLECTELEGKKKEKRWIQPDSTRFDLDLGDVR